MMMLIGECEKLSKGILGNVSQKNKIKTFDIFLSIETSSGVSKIK